MPAILRALVACGLFGIQTSIGGLALNTLLAAAWPAWAGVPRNIWIAFAIFWLVQVGIIIHGLEGIKKLESRRLSPEDLFKRHCRSGVAA